MKNESQHDKMTDTGALRELLARATPGPMRECGHDRGGCVCGLVFSLSEEIPVADFGLSGDEELRHARPGGEHRKANAALYAAAISVLPSMLAELDAARRDAERYRWLRAEGNELSVSDMIRSLSCSEDYCLLRTTQLDAAIDAAMADSTATEGR